MTPLRARPPRLGRDAAIVAAVTLVLAVIDLRLWEAAWDQPWLLDSDSVYYAMLVEGMRQHGGYLHNPSLGFPWGLDLRDQPEGGDNLHWLVLRLLAAVAGTFAAVNLFYVAGFALAAVGAFVAVRWMGAGRLAAGIAGVLYAFLPYHLARGQVHLMLSSYALVPLGVLVAWAFLGDDPPLVRRGGDGRRLELRSARTAWCVALVVGLGSTGPYHLTFVALLIVVAAGIAALAGGGWRVALAGALLVGVGAVTVLANNAPHLLRVAAAGENDAVANRPLSDAETYGLRVSQLFTPRPDHRIPALARLAEDSRSPVLLFSEPGQQLGVVGAAGLAAALVAAFAALAARTRPVGFGRHARPLALLALAAIVTAAVSGFSFVLALGGLRIVRAWDRAVVVIAVPALAAAALGVDAVVRRWVRPRWGPIGAAAALGAVGVIGWLDQTAPTDAPAHAAAQRTATEARQFFGAWSDRLGPGAPVYLAPHRTFPEGHLVHAYDGAIGYLFAPSLRWDFGVVVGRRPDYALAVDGLAPTDRLDALTAVGYEAYLVDRSEAARAGALEDDARAVLGPPLLTSAQGRWVGWDLRERRRALLARLGEAGVADLAARTLALDVPVTAPVA